MKKDKIIIREWLETRSKYNSESRYYVERANAIVGVLITLSMPVVEDKVREYAVKPSYGTMADDYITFEMERCGNPVGALADAVSDKAKAVYADAMRGAGLTRTFKYRNQAEQGMSQFVKYDECKGTFYVDDAAIEEDTTYYLADKDKPYYELHLQICELMTKFVRGDREAVDHLADYFQMDADGKVQPFFAGGYYPIEGKRTNRRTEPQR